MTNNTELAAADYRRATAALAHYVDRNWTGLNAIFEDTAEFGRISELILAILAVFEHRYPVLRTDAGKAMLQAEVMRLALLEADEAA